MWPTRLGEHTRLGGTMRPPLSTEAGRRVCAARCSVQGAARTLACRVCATRREARQVQAPGGGERQPGTAAWRDLLCFLVGAPFACALTRSRVAGPTS